MNIPQIAYPTNSNLKGATSMTNPSPVITRRRTHGSSVRTLASKATHAQDENNTLCRGSERSTLQTTSRIQYRDDTIRGTFCPYHKTKTHIPNECQKFRESGFQERKDFLSKNRVCFNCTNSNKHIAKQCDQGPPECGICHKNHVQFYMTRPNTTAAAQSPRLHAHRSVAKMERPARAPRSFL